MSYRTTRRVLADYEAWAIEKHLLPDDENDRGAARQWRERIDILLYARSDFLEKRDPTYWRSGDVHELLMQYCAPRQVDAWDLLTHAPSTVRDFLTFLDATGRLHPGSTRVSTLLKELDRLSPKFPAAMADESRWQLAKRILTAALADGISVGDEDALDRWAEKFSTLDAAARRPVLGPLLDDDPRFGTGLVVTHDGQVAVLLPTQMMPCKHKVWPDARCVCGECSEPAPVPELELPGNAELAAAIAGYGSGLLQRLVALADWIGPAGRPVDNHGELTRDGVRDAASFFEFLPFGETTSTANTRMRGLPRLGRLWRIALEFGVLELRNGLVVPGPALALAESVLGGDAAPDEALALWQGIFDDACTPIRPWENKQEDPLQEWMAHWPPRFLGYLLTQSLHGEDVSFAAAMTEVLLQDTDRIPPDDEEVFAEMAAFIVRVALGYVAEHGGVEVSGDATATAPPDGVIATMRSLDIEPSVLGPASGMRVRLTDLGRYAMRQQLS
jgi:hypothetical protein